MPEIARFLGIVIRMYFDDHDPPHFHACYGECEAVIDIRNLTLIRGSMPPRALGLLIEWAALHRDELMADWQRARLSEPLHRIAPLDRSPSHADHSQRPPPSYRHLRAA